MELAVDPGASLDEIAAQLRALLYPDADPPQARKRELILNAAAELFIAYGYRKTTVDDVAGAAGVAKGTVYLYYRNKAELFLYAIALQKLEYVNELAPVFDPSLSPKDRLRALIVLGVELSHRMPLLARFSGGDHEMEQVLQDVDSDTLERITQARVDFAASLIDEATGRRLPSELLQTRAQVLMDTVFAVVNGGRLLRNGMPIADYARELADVIVDGIVSAPAEFSATPPLPGGARRRCP